MGLNDLLAVAELTGSLPPAVALVGIQPGLLGVALEMSDALQAALPTAVSAAREAAWSLTEEQARA